MQELANAVATKRWNTLTKEALLVKLRNCAGFVFLGCKSLMPLACQSTRYIHQLVSVECALIFALKEIHASEKDVANFRSTSTQQPNKVSYFGETRFQYSIKF